jgi:formamidopyrimidine-DNA glycosylase
MTTGSAAWPSSPNGAAPRFIDRRKLGGVWLATDDTELHDLIGDLGSDALGLPCDELRAILGASRKQLKAALMDQSLLAGLGNMLSDEILWRARLHPTRVASTLAPAEGEAVVRCRAGSPGRVGSCRGDPSHAVVAVRSARHRRPDLSTVR